MDYDVRPNILSGWKTVKYFWKFILLAGFVMAVLGSLSFVFIPYRYVAVSKLAPEWNNTNKQMKVDLSFSALLKSVSSDETVSIRPEMFPTIISSELFVESLLDKKIGDGNLYDYVRRVRLSAFDFLSRDSEKSHIIKYVSNSVTAIVDTKTCLMTLWVKMPDCNVSIELSNLIVTSLKAYITDYLHQNAIAKFKFAQKIYETSRDDYYSSQEEYYGFIDSNQGISTTRDALSAVLLEEQMKQKLSQMEDMFREYNEAKTEMEFCPPVFSVVQTPVVLGSKSTGTFVRIVNFFLIGMLLSTLLIIFIKR